MDGEGENPAPDAEENSLELPNELVSHIMGLLRNRGWNATLLRLMLVQKRFFVIGLRIVLDDLLLAPGDPACEAKWRLLERGFEYAGTTPHRFVRVLRVKLDADVGPARLDALGKALRGADELELSCDDPVRVRTAWNALAWSDRLTRLCLRLTPRAWGAFQSTNRFPRSLSRVDLAEGCDTMEALGFLSMMERAPNLREWGLACFDHVPAWAWKNLPSLARRLRTAARVREHSLETILAEPAFTIERMSVCAHGPSLGKLDAYMPLLTGVRELSICTGEPVTVRPLALLPPNLEVLSLWTNSSPRTVEHYAALGPHGMQIRTRKEELLSMFRPGTEARTREGLMRSEPIRDDFCGCTATLFVRDAVGP